MYQIGVDIGGTFIKIGLLDDSLDIVAKTKFPFPQADASVMADRLRDAVRALLENSGVTFEQLESIGVVVPGSIDPTGSSVIDAHNLGYHNVPLKRLVSERFPGIPVYIANDANAAAVAELYRGAFVGCKTAVLFTLGTGVGGGVILNGHMFNGGRNQGVELGHAILVDGGEACTCGNRGCVEAYCSASALIRDGKRAMLSHPESSLWTACEGSADNLTPLILLECVLTEDPTAKAVFDTYLERLSSACATVFNILDPEVIAIGGGLSGAGELMFEPLQAMVTKKCFYNTRGKVVPAVMGNDAGMVGAAMLHRDAVN